MLLAQIRVQSQPSEVPVKNIVFQQLPEKLSLSQSSINCVLQDREGYLWIGTWSGLMRYDGYTTKVFYSGSDPHQIKSNKITTLYEDRAGYLWIGTPQGGLFRYEKNTDQLVEGLETGADDYVTKPFNPKVLQLKVQNLVRMRQVMQKLFQNTEVLHIEPRRVVLTSADESFVHEALESVENNISNANYAVEDLSRDVGMSRTQLYRKLKALTGQSANEFIRTLRLKRAAQLLEQNQLTVAEVTYEVGFTDLQHFRECFKKLFGVTPSDMHRNPPTKR